VYPRQGGGGETASHRCVSGHFQTSGRDKYKPGKYVHKVNHTEPRRWNDQPFLGAGCHGQMVCACALRGQLKRGAKSLKVRQSTEARIPSVEAARSPQSWPPWLQHAHDRPHITKICSDYAKKRLFLQSRRGILKAIKVKTSYRYGRWAGVLFWGATLRALAGDQIQTYTVPKEHPAIAFNAAPIRWTVPAGWTQKPADGFRLGSFAIHGQKAGKAEVAITSFPGAVGTELSNVNRWRGELALAPIEAGDLASEPVAVDSITGKLYDIAGPSGRTVVAVIPRNGKSWFIKLRGDTPTVAEAKSAFLEFLKSIHFNGDADDASQPAPVVAATDAADPHAGLGLQAGSVPHGDLAAPDAPSDAPKWNLPAQWVETPPRAMIFKSYSVADDSGAKAEVTVSFLQGEGGGLLANVNRWRGQLGQGPIEAGQLDGLTETLATSDGKATLLDFMGANAKTGQPARLVVAVVPHGQNTWFYKLMGDGKVVGGQKDSFVQFVKSVHYP
jgi:hypothetical protein